MMHTGLLSCFFDPSVLEFLEPESQIRGRDNTNAARFIGKKKVSSSIVQTLLVADVLYYDAGDTLCQLSLQIYCHYYFIRHKSFYNLSQLSTHSLDEILSFFTLLTEQSLMLLARLLCRNFNMKEVKELKETFL